MKNLHASGATIIVTSAGAKKSGDLVQAGDLHGVAGHDAATNEPVVVHLVGTYTLPKTAGAAWTVGAPLYFDGAAKTLTVDAASGANKKVGHAAEAAGSSDASGVVRLSN